MGIVIETSWGDRLFRSTKTRVAGALREAVLRKRVLDWADLRGMLLKKLDLDGARMDNVQANGANLEGASLRNASFRHASFEGASLAGATFCYADLFGADFEGADLRDVKFRYADLRRASFKGADLRGADLSMAAVAEADFRDANLAGAHLPSPAAMLGASWRGMSDRLCAALMQYDADNHPDPSAFQRWAEGGECPYRWVKVDRASHFFEKRELWSSRCRLTPHQLMAELTAEVCPPWTPEQDAAHKKGLLAKKKEAAAQRREDRAVRRRK